MLKRHVLMALVGGLALTGCQSPTQMLAEEQGTAPQVAARRGQFELNCPQVTTDLLSSNVLQPVLWGGQERAEYTVGVSGCGKRATYVVVCALGSPSCFAAASR